jgi:hypothetical protein
MKKNKNVYLSDLTKFSMNLLTVENQNSIKGGDFIDDMFSSIFDTSALPSTDGYDNMGQFYSGTQNTAILNRVKANFRDLYSTSMGKRIIDSIKDKNEQIILSPGEPSPNAIASYNDTNNTMLLGHLLQSGANSSVNDFAHELYHAYADISEGNLFDQGDVKREINAELFAFMTAIQYDKDHSINSTNPNSHVSTLQHFNPLSSSTQANIDFNNAWNDIIQNGDFTIQNYNTLITNFLNGSTWGAGYGSSALTENTISNIDTELFLDDWFNSFFKADYTTPPNTGNSGFYIDPNTGQWTFNFNSGFFVNGTFDFNAWYNWFSLNQSTTTTGGSTSGSGSGSSGNSGSGFFSWYNSMQNSGYQFYTGYSQITTTTGGWDQGAYSNGWLNDFTTTTTTTNYYEPTMGQWLGAWASGWNFGGGSSFWGGGSNWGFFPSHS